MRVLWILLGLVLVMAAAIFILGQLGFLRGREPTNLGVKQGRLKPPSKTPNSVSSQADLYPDHPQRAYASIAPLVFNGDPDVAFKKLRSLLATMAGVAIVAEESDYLYAQCTTSLMKFTDDLEFALDRENSTIHVRSSSRLGQRDFNANRKRVEAVRASFESN